MQFGFVFNKNVNGGWELRPSADFSQPRMELGELPPVRQNRDRNTAEGGGATCAWVSPGIDWLNTYFRG